MNILVACEESQEVCKELRKRGHRAFSCDIQGCSGGHPEWHIQSDVTNLVNGNCSFRLQNGQIDEQKGKWDMIIAFPPCTHLAVSGAWCFKKKREDGRQRDGIELFCLFLNADCDKIAIENPIGIIGGGNYVKQYFPDLAEKYKLPRKQTQIIQPWYWNDNVRKTTCLWLKGLPLLKPEVTKEPPLQFREWTDSKGQKKKEPLWISDVPCSRADRAKIRSKTFHGIAVAMATQWTENLVK